MTDRTPELEQLFRDNYATLVRTLAVACASTAMAEDAVMDAFVEAHRNWARIVSYDNPGAWIRRVALNRLSKRRRDQRRGQRLAAALSRQAPSSTSLGVPSRLIDLFRQLPAQQRIAAALFYIEDLSVADVADSMQVSEGTVKTHLRRAREHLAPGLEVHINDI